MTLRFPHREAAAGIEVVSVRLNHLTCAPEIALAMLMRQQALALIDARKTTEDTEDGAVLMVRGAVTKVEIDGYELSRTNAEELVTNLLIVLCTADLLNLCAARRFCHAPPGSRRDAKRRVCAVSASLLHCGLPRCGGDHARPMIQVQAKSTEA